MKIPAEFLPKSWEMPPSARVIEESEYSAYSACVVARDFDGKTLDWLAALVEWPTGDKIKWARPLDSRFDAGFVVLGQGDYIYKDCFSSKDQLSFSAIWEENEFARQFFLNEDGELRGENEKESGAILVTPDGMATWSSLPLEMKVDEKTMFKWSEPLEESEFLRLSSRDLWERLQSLLKDPDSEAHFARRFGIMSDKERVKLVFRKKRGTNKQIQELLRVLALAKGIWDEVPEEKNLEIHLSATTEDEVLSWYNGQWFEFIGANSSLLADVSQVREWFLPMRPEFMKRSCVQNWLRYYSGPHQFFESISRPTAHEQLEAHLLWREWKATQESEKI